MNAREPSVQGNDAALEAEPTLRDRVVLVTGGGRGLGAATCRALAQRGAIPIVADLARDSADALSATIVAEGGRAHSLALDVGDDASASGAIDEVVERFGRLDAVINNAAIDITVPIDELSPADWSRVVQTNLTGPFLVARHAAVVMKRQGEGAIVNIASTASKRAWPNASAYHATKWGLLGLSHALHAELRPHGIKVTAIVAGGMRTPFLLDRFEGIDIETLQDPANVARTICFVLMQPAGTVIPEVMVLPMRESSWP